MNPRRPNYWEYIRVEELLALQGGLEGDESQLRDDEVMFITVHQVYELWFKLLLRQFTTVRNLFSGPRVAETELADAVHGLRRCVVILRRCVEHFEVMETLRTREYLEFRDKLTPASGFQSAQMRQLEILLGLEDAERISLGVEGSYLDALRDHDGKPSPASARVERQKRDGPSVRVAIEDWLRRTPIDGVAADEPSAEESLAGFTEAYAQAHAREVDRSAHAALVHVGSADERRRLLERYQREKDSLTRFLGGSAEEGGPARRRLRAALLFILTYQDLALLAWPGAVLDGLIELEQAFTIFRQRHARMVERVIGRRTGTGGSAGVDYLDQTALAYRVFRDLWAVRTYQLRASAAPALQNPAFYGFAVG